MIAHAVVAASCQPTGKHGLGKASPWIKEVLDAFPRLWELLLQHRAILVYGFNDEGHIDGVDLRQKGDAATLRYLICDLLIAHIYLAEAEK